MNNVVFVIVSLVCGVLGLTSGQAPCGLNQVYSRCVDTCHITCANYKNPPRGCGMYCSEGCDCKPGHVWLGNICIPKNLCPREAELLCPMNRTFQYGDIVIKTCDNLQLTPTTPGCYCKPNYYYNRFTARCVLRSDCPKRIACPANEEKEICGSPCPATCKQPNPLPCPLRSCEPSCKCKAPLLRDQEKGSCVLPWMCPRDGGPDKLCLGEHEEHKLCGSRCPPTCREMNRSCPHIPCGPGCFCKFGYIREHIGGKCVPYEKCL